MFRIHDPSVDPDAPGGPLPPVGALISTNREQLWVGSLQEDIDVRLVQLVSRPEAIAYLLAGLARGDLRTRVARTYPLTEVAEAHRVAEAGGLKGKVVLTP